MDFWTCLRLPCTPPAAAAAVNAAAASANGTPPANVIVRGGPVEPGDESAVQRLSRELDLACWQFVCHTMRVHLGCGHSINPDLHCRL